MATPAKDSVDFIDIDFKGHVLQVKTKFKIFKFMKAINENPIEAILLAVTEESATILEDEEMSFNDFEELIGKISEAISGTTPGN